METWQYFLIWNKSNLKKCLGEPNSAAPQQVLCPSSVQGACSVSERFDSSPEPCEAQRGGRRGTEDMAPTLCTVTGHCWAVQAGNALTCSGLALEAAARQTSGSGTVSEDSSMALCVLQLPIPLSPLLNHLWIYHPLVVLERGWTACAFLTNHPCFLLTHFSSQIRVTSMDSRVLPGLPGSKEERRGSLSREPCVSRPAGARRILSPHKNFLLSLNKKE